jgi:hypothetical protein
MCDDLRVITSADQTRDRAHRDGHAAAAALARRLPLVHRTRGANLSAMLADARLTARDPCTEHERDCGIARALYFFLGCIAYPEGTVAFVVANHILNHAAATYTPFDTGALVKHARPRDPTAPWAEQDKRPFLEAHLGRGPDALDFAAEYIAGHFHRAADYTSRPQQSAPDFPAYHGLESASGDRRAWSLEVQLHEDLSLVPGNIDALVLADHDLLADIPDDLKQTTLVAEDEGSLVAMVQQLIAEEPPL